MKEWMKRRMRDEDGWEDGCMDERMDGRKDECTDGKRGQ